MAMALRVREHHLPLFREWSHRTHPQTAHPRPGAIIGVRKACHSARVRVLNVSVKKVRRGACSGPGGFLAISIRSSRSKAVSKLVANLIQVPRNQKLTIRGFVQIGQG